MHRDEDEAWRSIVENYGDRALIGPEDEAPPEPAAPQPASSYESWEQGEADDSEGSSDEEFVPPDPDPAPLPSTDRLVAWIGVLGSPLALVLFVAFSVSVPGWAALLLAAGFVGGFLYLVARLPSGRDPWDDGARL